MLDSKILHRGFDISSHEFSYFEEFISDASAVCSSSLSLRTYDMYLIFLFEEECVYEAI